MARKWLPRILALGNSTGNNTTRQLGFHSVEEESDLATTIQKAMLNDCPDARQEALLAVKWNEPTILREKLEEMNGKANASASGGAYADKATLRRSTSGVISADLLSLSKDHGRLVEKVQAAYRGLLSRKRAQALKDQQASLMLIALERAKLDVVETLLEYSGETPDAFKVSRQPSCRANSRSLATQRLQAHTRATVCALSPAR